MYSISKNELLTISKNKLLPTNIMVNGHVHTPYSFSAFNNIEEIFKTAQSENIKALGINDFNTTEGYKEFYEFSIKYKIFPLFNIEFMTLMKDYQNKGLRVNDPNNPGRTYFSGKGLRFPITLSNKNQTLLNQIKDESTRQVTCMIEQVNNLLNQINAHFTLNVEEIKTNFTNGQLRERHVAKAIRIYAEKFYSEIPDRINFYNSLFSDSTLQSNINDYANLENEIRNKLLKKGGKAFVPEDEKAFLSLNQAIEIILDAGGIPCYPVLLDDKNGNITDFEHNYIAMLEYLKKMNIYCIELIPSRNSYEILNEFVQFFNNHNFIIIFGTEHNTPELTPLTITCRNNVPLTDELKQIAFEGTCVIAAHQYLTSINENGYVDRNGTIAISKKTEFYNLGNALINWFNNQ